MRVAESPHGGVAALFLPLVWLFGWKTFQLPACVGCGKRLRMQRWLRNALTWVLVIAAVSFVYPYVQHFEVVTRRIVGGGLALLCLMPYVLFEVFWPRHFAVTFRTPVIEYEFSREDYAASFADANRAAVFVEPEPGPPRG